MGRPDHPFVSGVILAAGRGRRMGEAKQLLPLAGKPILQHVVDAAAASILDEIVVVLGYRADEIRAAIAWPPKPVVRVVVNDDYAKGQGASLARGLRSCDEQAAGAAVLLGDQPGVPPTLIDRVVRSFRTADVGRTPIVRPVYRGEGRRAVPGHPVVLARSVWHEVSRITGDRGARVLIAARPDDVLELPIESPPPPDIDTPEDYRSLPTA